MDFSLGEFYTLPEGANPSWFRDSLQEVRRVRVGDVPITLLLRDRTQVTRNLDAADRASDPEDDYGSVYLESLRDPESLREFPCRSIAGFYLVPDDPIDHSDELRGGSVMG